MTELLKWVGYDFSPPLINAVDVSGLKSYPCEFETVVEIRYV